MCGGGREGGDTHTRGDQTKLESSPARRGNIIIIIIIYTALAQARILDPGMHPGVTLNLDEKLILASKLSALGVDVCEAGFPIASNVRRRFPLYLARSLRLLGECWNVS